jgi:hypothetical protein
MNMLWKLGSNQAKIHAITDPTWQRQLLSTYERFTDP